MDRSQKCDAAAAYRAVRPDYIVCVLGLGRREMYDRICADHGCFHVADRTKELGFGLCHVHHALRNLPQTGVAGDFHRVWQY
jgi:hypothetical protein